MRRTVAILLAILIVAVAWLFLQHFDVRGLDQVQVTPKTNLSQRDTTVDLDGSSVSWTRDTTTKKASIFDRLTQSSSKSDARKSIRIASFNLQTFGAEKASNFEVMDILSIVLRKFDIVSIQELTSDRSNVLPSLVDRMNASNNTFDYVVGPRLGPIGQQEQYAFIFNRDAVYLDREALYTVDDPHDQMQWEPLVAWFRARGPDPKAAFTFSLVNVHVSPNRRAELNVLDDVLYAIRRDGRNEDDVVIAGDFGANHETMGQLGALPGVVMAIAQATNTRGTAQRDNIVIQLPATEEFSGRSGVFDFMRAYNLTLDQSLQVSDHLPVWAEFSVFEGGYGGRVATTKPTSIEEPLVSLTN